MTQIHWLLPLSDHTCAEYPCDPPKALKQMCDSIDGSVLNQKSCNEGIDSFKANTATYLSANIKPMIASYSPKIGLCDDLFVDISASKGSGPFPWELLSFITIECQGIEDTFDCDSNPLAANVIIDQTKLSVAAFREMLTSKKYSVKTTVISTTCTLVGQWYDEIKKWAPSLVVKVYHGSYNKHADRMKDSMDMRDVDILLTVSTTKLTSRHSP